ncbi:MAG: hypothetical protein IKS42_12135 [Oscillospiraceae bacterium]|nr:hypothetical protein [Oscillospiraceae bacterium]
MPTHAQLLKQYVSSLWRVMLPLLGGLLVCTAALWAAFGRRASLPLLLAGAAAVWLILNFLLYTWVLRKLKREKPLYDLMAEKGVCDEVLQKHREIYPNPGIEEQLRYIDMLILLERYTEAETLLRAIVPKQVQPPQQLIFYNCRMLLCTETGRAAEAYQILSANRTMLDSYAKLNSQAASAYYATASLVYALHGDADTSAYYCDLVRAHDSDGNDVLRLIAEIACAERLYALRQTAEADALADSIRAKIAAADMKDWQRDRLLHAVSKASRYSQTV